jgi:hypothetical protein
MADEAFKLYIQEAIEKLGVNRISSEFGIAKPSIRRWAEGVSFPQSVIRPHVIKFIDELLVKENKL